jgi:hypothetical protein
MSPDNWRLLDRIYNEVLEKPPEERGRFLTAACADFPSGVRAEVAEQLSIGRDKAFQMSKVALAFLRERLGPSFSD